MNLTKTWLAGILLGGAALGAMCDNLFAQAWQPKWTSDNGAASSDWQQRVLKQSQPAQQPITQQSDNVVYQQPAANVYRQPAANVYRQPAANVYQQPAGRYQVAQRPSSARGPFASATASEEPRVANRPRVNWVSGDEEVIEPGAMQYEQVASDGVFAGGGGCGGAGCGGPGCGDCGSGGGLACESGCDFGWEVFDGTCGPWLRGLSVFVGADGFKGALDRGTNGSFGLNEGLNLARPLGDPWGCGYQIGVNFVQSNFSGAPNVTVPNPEGGVFNLRAPMRRQYFATAAIFNRAVCGGFQWGVAYDYLHDIYYQSADLQQIRSLTGYVIDDVYEVGYYGAYSVGTDRVIDGKLDSTDMFVCYLRRNFENGGDGRIWGGASGRGDGLLGVDLWVPLGKGFALENRINYMIPKEGRGDVARTRESWGLVAQLVWYPGQNARCQQQNPYRPMFNVADNSLFMVDRMGQ